MFICTLFVFLPECHLPVLDNLHEKSFECEIKKVYGIHDLTELLKS